jgi:hypothetical protein
VVHVAWGSEDDEDEDSVPAPGKYCLHTRLEHEDDPANGDGRAFMDNNKVQLNVVVQDNLPDAPASLSCVLENPGTEPATVDVVLTRLDRSRRSPRLALRMPAGLPVTGVEGATTRTANAWRRVEMDPRARRAVIRGVTLPARSKRDAILTVTSPAGSARGECFVFKISEEIDGEEKGGVVVRTRTSTEDRVLAAVLRRTERFWRAMDGRFRVQTADAMRRECEASRRLCLPEDRAALLPRLRAMVSAGAKVREEVRNRLGDRHEASIRAFLADSARALDRGRLDELLEAQRHVMIAFRPLFLGRE